MGLRLAVIVSHPIPHFAPWHRQVAEQGEIEQRVFFSSDLGIAGHRDADFGTELVWDIPLTEGYEHEFPADASERRGHGFFDLDLPDLDPRFDDFDPHVIQLYGYQGRRFWRAVRWARRRGRPLLIYSDAHRGEDRFRSQWKAAIKRRVIPLLYRRIDGALTVGDQNREHHAYYGIPEERLFEGCLPIDRERLLASAPDPAEARRRLRSQLGIPSDAYVALFCGKLIDRKRPLDLIEACASLEVAGRPVFALLVGAGPQSEELEQAAKRAGAQAVCAGFVNQSEISGYFAAADALAVTSSFDPHPLVVTEACAFGLPVVASDAIGCVGAGDTARPNVNALVYPCGDVGALREALTTLAGDPALHERASKAGLEIAEGQDAAVAARQLAEATRRLHELGPRRR